MTNSAPLNDLHGLAFGDLVVESYISGSKYTKSKWVCRCRCGKTCHNTTNQLLSGKSKSCGCTKYARIGLKKTVHGHTANGVSSRTYRIWTNMKTRCTNPRSENFAFYGGRGIGFAQEWNSFERFLSDMGSCPDGMTLDRKDSNGNYTSTNCRWATTTEQANNTSRNRLLTIRGERLTMSQAARANGLSVGTVWFRLKLGWSDEEAIGICRREKKSHKSS